MRGRKEKKGKKDCENKEKRVTHSIMSSDLLISLLIGVERQRALASYLLPRTTREGDACDGGEGDTDPVLIRTMVGSRGERGCTVTGLESCGTVDA